MTFIDVFKCFLLTCELKMQNMQNRTVPREHLARLVKTAHVTIFSCADPSGRQVERDARPNEIFYRITVPARATAGRNAGCFGNPPRFLNLKWK